MAATYRQVEHTADFAIEVEADSLPELFEAATRGMFEIILGSPPKARAAELPNWRPVEVRGADLGELLVNWLGELLALYALETVLPAGVRNLRIGDGRAAGVVGFVPLGSAEPETELKAVTYHDVAVELRDGRWRARIVFDV
ncbi:MAG: archease [Gemmatimonadetes bacterium]|nr:archease [Gemmatimonadota bacterium]